MMKWMTFVLAAALVVGVVGCGDSGSAKGSGDKELTLTAPGGETTIAQGKTAEVTVKVDRKNFDEDVSLTFSDLPRGVSVKESDTKVAKGSKDRKFTLEAKDDATEGTHTAKVSGKSGEMEVKNKEFKIVVKK